MYDNGKAVAKGWVNSSGSNKIKLLSNTANWDIEIDELIESVQ